MKCYVIHLASATERLPIVQRLFADSKLETVIVDAVDKNALQDQKIEELLAPGLFRPHYPFPMGMGEIACFLSHRKVWKMIFDSGDDFALVLEDDVQLQNPAFAKQLLFAVKQASPEHLVRFPSKPRRDKGRTVAKGDGMALLEPAIPGLQTCATLVGRLAAAKLLEKTNQIDRPVDGFLQLIWSHQVEILAMLPPCITEIGRGTGKSLVQTKGGSVIATVKREISRWRYRRALAKASQNFSAVNPQAQFRR